MGLTVIDRGISARKALDRFPRPMINYRELSLGIPISSRAAHSSSKTCSSYYTTQHRKCLFIARPKDHSGPAGGGRAAPTGLPPDRSDLERIWQGEARREARTGGAPLDFFLG